GQQPGIAEQPSEGIVCFGDAVGSGHNQVTGVNLGAIYCELNLGEKPHGKIGGVGAIDATLGADNEGWNVPSIDKLKSSLPVQHAVKERGKHCRERAIAQVIVNPPKKLAEVGRASSDGTKGPLEACRHQGGGQPFSRYISQGEAVTAVGKFHYVIVITPYGFCWRGNA